MRQGGGCCGTLILTSDPASMCGGAAGGGRRRGRCAGGVDGKPGGLRVAPRPWRRQDTGALPAPAKAPSMPRRDMPGSLGCTPPAPVTPSGVVARPPSAPVCVRQAASGGWRERAGASARGGVRRAAAGAAGPPGRGRAPAEEEGVQHRAQARRRHQGRLGRQPARLCVPPPPLEGGLGLGLR